MYFKVKFSETFTEGTQERERTFTKIVAAKSEKELDEKICEYAGLASYEDSLAVLEKSKVSKAEFDELAALEEKKLFNAVFYKYLQMKLKPRKLDPQKYAELKKKYLDNPQYRYEMLLYVNKSLDVEDYLGRYRKFGKDAMRDMSAKQFFDRVEVLSEGDSDAIG